MTKKLYYYIRKVKVSTEVLEVWSSYAAYESDHKMAHTGSVIRSSSIGPDKTEVIEQFREMTPTELILMGVNSKETEGTRK